MYVCMFFYLYPSLIFLPIDLCILYGVTISFITVLVFNLLKKSVMEIDVVVGHERVSVRDELGYVWVKSLVPLDL